MTTEKNALAERLKKAETAQRRLEEEVKRHATEAMRRQVLLSEVRQLEESVSKAEAEKREKQKQVTQCETFIGSLKGKLEVAHVRPLFLFFVQFRKIGAWFNETV